LLEISSLVQHGYCVARHVCRKRPDLFGDDLPTDAPWDPVRRTARTGHSEPLNERSREPASATVDGRKLHRSAIRRIWSSLLDPRDWASWVYVPLMIPILVLLPWVATEYQRSHRIYQIAKSLSQGSRDLEQMSRLLDRHVVPWKGEAPEEVRKINEPELTGFEILQDMRILDLRNWTPMAEGSSDAESFVYGYRRLKVFKKPDQAGSTPFRMLLISTSPLAQVRFPPLISCLNRMRLPCQLPWSVSPLCR
jgi:hypothetical protein